MDTKINLFLKRENDAWCQPKPPLPVTLVTGFLGSGKTTLLRHILAHRENLNIVFAVNDIVGQVDSAAIKKVLPLNNGCTCCSLQDDLKIKLFNTHEELVANRKIEYLVIETSGVTDPKRIIAMLDENFGKMYYIRLDCVVTVIDSDYLFQAIQSSDVGFSTRSQIIHADIILLNKTDLVSPPQIKEVKQLIHSLSPNSIVYETLYSAVPLPFILDLEDQPDLPQGVSHEKVSKQYQTSKVGKKHRKKPNEQLVQEEQARQGDHNHIESDSFNSFVFESKEPLELYKFQEFLYGLDDSVIRMKVFFADSAQSKFTFHMSGRKRFQIGEEAKWDMKPFNELVLIGRKLDKEVLIEKLKDVSVRAPYNKNEMKVDGVLLSDKIKNDNRFEFLTVREDIVEFRATGYLACGFSIDALVLHGVNLNQMNHEICQNFNSGEGQLFLVEYRDPEKNEVWIRFSQQAQIDGSVFWSSFSNYADLAIEKYFQHICGCRKYCKKSEPQLSDKTVARKRLLLGSHDHRFAALIQSNGDISVLRFPPLSAMDEDLQSELETISAIFMEDYKILNDNPRHIELRLVPIPDAADASENKGINHLDLIVNLPVAIKMEIKIPTDYPNAIPTVNLNSLKGVPKRVLDELQAKIKEEATTNLGEQMLFMLIQVVKEWLEDNNNQDDSSAKRKAAAMPAEDYKDGTPVTVESYKAWWAEFQAEMTSLKKGATTTEQLTGKQYFLKMGDAALEGDDEDSDEEVVVEDENLDETDVPVDVNWEVFEQELQGADLEDLDDDFSDEDAGANDDTN